MKHTTNTAESTTYTIIFTMVAIVLLQSLFNMFGFNIYINLAVGTVIAIIGALSLASVLKKNSTK